MRWIQNKRTIIAQVLRATGGLRLLEHWARRPGLLTLVYHRIGEPSGQPFYPRVFSATPEAFRDEMIALSRTRRIITLEEAVALLESGRPLEEPLALVTFDDGYRDNVDAALPVLSALGVPAAFFLTTAFVDGTLLPWWDHVAYAVNKATVSSLRLDHPAPLAIDLARTARSDAIVPIIDAYLAHPDVDERSLRSELEARAGVSVDEATLSRSLFMTWDDARKLAASGMSIGSHTQTHRALARLSEEDQRGEMTASRARIASEIGRDVMSLAYPYGWPGAIDATTPRLARAAGYRAAFTATEGVNTPKCDDPLSLRRINVGSAEPPVLHRARWALHGATGKSIL